MCYWLGEALVNIMTTPITITLPDNLSERLESVGEDIDILAICVKALEAAATMAERMRGALLADEEVLIRLKYEANVVFDDWYQKGWCKGAELAPTLSFEQLQYVVLWYQVTGGEDKETARSLLEIVPYDNFLINALDIETYPGYMANAYVMGAVAGIAEFWEEFEHQIHVEAGNDDLLYDD